MAPNSEDGVRINNFSWNEECISKEKQRPPIYNPEDYALSLKKWGRKPPANGPGLYSTPSVVATVDPERSRTKSHSFRDYRNPMLSENEMTLRQFGTVSELLCKLKSDLRLSYVSFVQEFVADPLDGATLLLDVLRIIQLSQANSSTSGSSNTTGRVPPSVQRRALLDELSCLQCLMYCVIRYNESVRTISTSSSGLFTLSVCIMSNVTKSRIIALQVLTKVCSVADLGHTSVSEALSTLRLRFGEPVRFRFLVGMLTSSGNQSELLAAGLEFLNAFLDHCGNTQNRLYIQAELAQAGLDMDVIKKNVSLDSSSSERILKEFERWEKGFIDIEGLSKRFEDLEKNNDVLKDKVMLLERKIKILQEEKGVLMSLEQCLKTKCNELQDEVISLQSKNKSSLKKSEKDRFSPAIDEGISSSERSLTPNMIEIEDETTIEEVMEELNNIINNAENEDLKREEAKKKLKDKERIKIEKAQIESKLIKTNDIFSDYDYESEIIPTNLHPQPPRKSKSMVHLYVPSEDYDCPKEFFENETAFSSEEGSDSLLSASKCIPKYNKNNLKLKLLNQKSESFKNPTIIKKNSLDNNNIQRSRSHPNRSKSLDRIDDGLDAIIDIVVTDQFANKSDSNVFTTKLSKCLSQQNLERNKMFLPANKFQSADTHYYFPRVQEKRHASTSFLTKRPNAGLYSGQQIVTTGSKTKKTEYFASVGSKNSSGKVTDIPSGLY
ncbi:uncharacterized protein [Onthophagus taurus]|nr:uncharacterized protein LOC111417167 isoform X2 [Onthophagus taurus]